MGHQNNALVVARFENEEIFGGNCTLVCRSLFYLLLFGRIAKDGEKTRGGEYGNFLWSARAKARRQGTATTKIKRK